MKINIILKIISSLFRIFLIFLIALVWSRYFIRDSLISVTTAIFITILCEVIIYFFHGRKQNNIKARQEEIKLIENINNSFIFNDDKTTADFFYNLAKTKHQCVKKFKYIEIMHDDGNVILYPFYTYRSFSSDDLIYIYNRVKEQNIKRIVICTSSIDPNSKKLAEKLPISVIILGCDDVYLKLLKPYNYFPKTTINLKESSKVSYGELLAYSLNKKRTKGYFFASILLLLSSFVVSYSIYYVIMSSFLLLLSLISFINPKFNKKLPMEILN